MKNILTKFLILSTIIFCVACNLDEVPNPNAPTFESFEEGASKADLDLLAVGLAAVMRNDLHFHYQTTSILARDYYDLTGIDPRFTQEILKGPLDNNGFITTRSYAAWYKIVQSSNLLEKATLNSEAGLNDAQKSAYVGYAQTLKAYALLMVSSRQYDNGIRVDVADKANLGPIISYDAALTEIISLLNTAKDELENTGSSAVFHLSTVGDIDLLEFNRAIAARAAIYQGNKSLALSLLNESFMDLTANGTIGVYHIFGNTGNDIANQQYYVPNQSANEFMAHDSWVADAEVGDTRLSKVGLFEVEESPNVFVPERQSFDGLSADYQVRLYSSNTDPVALIRNEELILLYAEANIGTNNTEAIAALDVIRNAAGLPDYSGATTDAALEDELLVQRRYSLFGEGHRWVDLRRFGRMDEIPLDRAGDNVIDAFPTPVTENEVLGG